MLLTHTASKISPSSFTNSSLKPHVAIAIGDSQRSAGVHDADDTHCSGVSAPKRVIKGQPGQAAQSSSVAGRRCDYCLHAQWVPLVLQLSPGCNQIAGLTHTKNHIAFTPPVTGKQGSRRQMTAVGAASPTLAVSADRREENKNTQKKKALANLSNRSSMLLLLSGTLRNVCRYDSAAFVPDFIFMSGFQKRSFSRGSRQARVKWQKMSLISVTFAPVTYLS